MNQPSLAGIEIASLWPRHLLEVANLAHSRYFVPPDTWLSFDEDLRKNHKLARLTAQSIGNRPVDWEALPYLLGWHTPERIEELIHRDWIADDTNEFAAHVPVFEALPALFDVERVTLAGAGVCRLAHWLTARSSTLKAHCTDLSPFALAAGKALVRGEYQSLPANLRRPCERVIGSASNDLKFETSPVAVVAAHEGASRISFAQDDCYSLNSLNGAQTIALLYVLDVPPFFDSMLVRTLEKAKVGDRIVILTNVTARRDPRLIVASLRKLGVALEHVRVVDLPYSLSRHDFTYTRALCPTLIVQGTMASQMDLAQVRAYPTAKFEVMAELLARPIFPGQAAPAIVLGKWTDSRERERFVRALEQAFAQKPYLRLKGELSQIFGGSQVETVLTYLLARCMAMLTCVRGHDS
jgi:hypothetical protein